MKTYVTTVVEDGDDLVMPFPDSLMEDMKWKKGDVLKWSIHRDHAVIQKMADPVETLRKFEGIDENSSNQ